MVEIIHRRLGEIFLRVEFSQHAPHRVRVLVEYDNVLNGYFSKRLGERLYVTQGMQ